MQRASSRPGKPARRPCGRRGAGRGGVSLWPWSEAAREAGAEPRWQGTMVEAWYMDDSREDPRKPHRPEPDRPVSLEQLSRLGVFYWKVGRGGGGGGRRAASETCKRCPVSGSVCSELARNQAGAARDKRDRLVLRGGEGFSGLAWESRAPNPPLATEHTSRPEAARFVLELTGAC